MIPFWRKRIQGVYKGADMSRPQQHRHLKRKDTPDNPCFYRILHSVLRSGLETAYLLFRTELCAAVSDRPFFPADRKYVHFSKRGAYFSAPALKNALALSGVHSSENMEREEQKRGAFP